MLGLLSHVTFFESVKKLHSVLSNLPMVEINVLFLIFVLPLSKLVFQNGVRVTFG